VTLQKFGHVVFKTIVISDRTVFAYTSTTPSAWFTHQVHPWFTHQAQLSCQRHLFLCQVA